MSVSQEPSRLVFQQLNRQLRKLAAKPVAKSVHKFRTSSRRVEALLEEMVEHPGRNDRKLLKLLSRLRRKAGRVRDLDVQIGLLRNLKIAQEAGRKSQLLRLLVEEREQRERQMVKAFDEEALSELRKRLKRAAGEEIPDGADALKLAVRHLAQLERSPAPLTEKVLHQYRIVGKRARYLAELDEKDAEALRLVEQLKQMQDVIGDWHDWLKLAEKAENIFGGVHDSPLVAALRNVTRAKYRQALEALSETRAAMAAERILPEDKDIAAGRRSPAPAARAAAAVA